jgi:hypothetical protein
VTFPSRAAVRVGRSLLLRMQYQLLHPPIQQLSDVELILGRMLQRPGVLVGGFLLAPEHHDDSAFGIELETMSESLSIPKMPSRSTRTVRANDHPQRFLTISQMNLPSASNREKPVFR